MRAKPKVVGIVLFPGKKNGVKHGSCQIKTVLNDSCGASNNSLMDGVVWQQ